ncbi:MAG: methyltransferase domain-containing protein [Acidimicrobiia bacterium]
MDRSTIDAYELGARRWRDHRPARFLDRVATFGAAVRDEGIIADLGCGAGLHLPELADHVNGSLVALDATAAMLDLVPQIAPGAWRVRGDLEHLPFRRGALDGVWARASYLHVPRTHLPLALADLHHALAVDAPAHLTMMRKHADGPMADDALPGRQFVSWEPDPLRAVLVGAGFDVVSVEIDPDEEVWVHAMVRRAHTLPDFVGANMRLLVIGLNPSVLSADVGVGFARNGNRFWPAALAAGIVSRDRDPHHALAHHGVGMTDLVKRATARADELSNDEYRDGAARVERLVEWLQPGAVCFVGLGGYRVAVDRKATSGVQPERFGGVPAYVMPNTSGLNARVPPSELTDHLRNAAVLADESRVSR